MPCWGSQQRPIRAIAEAGYLGECQTAGLHAIRLFWVKSRARAESLARAMRYPVPDCFPKLNEWLS